MKNAVAFRPASSGQRLSGLRHGMEEDGLHTCLVLACGVQDGGKTWKATWEGLRHLLTPQASGTQAKGCCRRLPSCPKGIPGIVEGTSCMMTELAY